MKIKCEFCKTEYSGQFPAAVPVKCAVCGHTWVPPRANRRGPLMVLLASLCALLSAIVFTIAVVARHQIDAASTGPLVARATAVRTVTDDAGNARLAVDGVVENVSGEIYGVPDLIVVAYDAHDNVIAQQKFMPTATLLDAGGHSQFSYTMSISPMGVRRVSVRLATGGTAK